jgi:hypothetical protein
MIMIGIGIPSSQSRIGISDPPLAVALGRWESSCPTLATTEKASGRLDHSVVYRCHTVATRQLTLTEVIKRGANRLRHAPGMRHRYHQDWADVVFAEPGQLPQFRAAKSRAHAIQVACELLWPAPERRPTEISDRRVSTLRIVEAFNVVEHVRFGFVARAVGLARNAFGFRRGEEALHRGIVPLVARAAHRADDAVVGHQSLNCSLVYWLDSMVVATIAAGMASEDADFGLRRDIAVADNCLMQETCWPDSGNTGSDRGHGVEGDRGSAT